VLGFNRGIVAPDCCHGPCLHGGHGFTAREDDGGWLRLHDRPQCFGGELTERTSLPLAVIALGEIRFYEWGERFCLPIQNVLGGLLAAFERARDNASQGDAREPIRRLSGLILPHLIQADAFCPAGQNSGGICGGATMPHKNDCGHTSSLVTMAPTSRTQDAAGSSWFQSASAFLEDDDAANRSWDGWLGE
jgi:hypothetical protein